MKGEIVKFVLALVALGGLFSSGVANAQSCSTWASNIVQFAQANPAAGWGARLATNNGKYVAYSATANGSTEGMPLAYVPGHLSIGGYIPPHLTSTAPQYVYFSDRTYDADINGVSYGGEPFSPAATDNLGVTIWLGTGRLVQPGEVTFTNTTVNFVPERCDAVGAPPTGIIYGLYGNTGLLLSLFTGIQRLN